MGKMKVWGIKVFFFLKLEKRKKISTAGASYLSSLHKTQRKVTAIEERHLGDWRGRWGGMGRAGSRRSWASLKLV